MLITLEPGEFSLDGGGDGRESKASCTGRTGVTADLLSISRPGAFKDERFGGQRL